MKKFFRVLLGVIAAILVLIAGGLIYVTISLPDVGEAPNLEIAATPELIARGRYLANHVTVCIDCHSQRDFSFYSGPVVPGTEGRGGEEMVETIGKLRVPNITPAALGNWTDGEIARAIAAGVGKNGEALFPMMPYPIYNELAEEDLHAIIAYLRTLPLIANDVPRSQLNFPMNLIVRTIPKSYVPKPRPPAGDTLAHGKYLNIVSGCHFCHTPVDDKGGALPGMDFAGGQEFRLPGGAVVRTANLTPENDTGIGGWDETYFVNRFKEYADSAATRIAVAPGGENTVMPWTMYAGMTEDDLRAIYRYLRTVKPVIHQVEKHPQPQTTEE
ncbi:MAG: cytochrome c [candidate division KSB1 bacterium]|nr:cytochrome c [candidate division KSB1 bacterium]MDZ7275300.1 cytochrome c [candidate division KSB1 bacterium]MDZ7287468.1 cytochrome c [candidate division KSB1 bacterium]MDZ7299582.1 cytochrome c [candidate division KSB1 bacterium]MDZ7307334.1 cytochrome c [candidate division KSB1 bacterium]